MKNPIKQWLERAEDEPLEFDNRYCATPVSGGTIKKVNHEKQKVFESWLADNRKVIERLNTMNDRPKTIKFFDELFTTDKRIKQLLREKNKGKKIIGTYCNVIPFELIIAAGAIPVRLCSGDTNAMSAGEQIFPRDSCPLIKSSVGWAITDNPFFEMCDTLIVPGTCDGKKKMGEVLSDYKPVWTISLPQDKERIKSVKYWQSEQYIIKKRIEGLTGRKITKDSLKEAILLYFEIQKIHRRMLELRTHGIISGSDFFIVTQAMFIADPKEWIKNSENLIEELDRRVKEKDKEKIKNKVRLLLTGAPVILPNFKLPLLIESTDSIIIADILCSSSQFLYDQVVIDEWNMSDMMNAIAERYLMPSVCPCFLKSEDRIDKLIDTVQEYKIDGVIYHTLRLCLLFDIESKRLGKVLESRDIPYIIINTDYSQEDQGQLMTRIEAFVEILKERKK